MAALPNAKMQTHAAADTTNMIAIDTKKRMMGRREKSIPDSATMAKSLTNGSLDETMADPRMAANSRQGMTALMGLTLLPNTTKNEWNLGSGLQKQQKNIEHFYFEENRNIFTYVYSSAESTVKLTKELFQLERCEFDNQ